MEVNSNVRLMAVVKLLNEIEVKGHDNMARLLTAINELSMMAQAQEPQPEIEIKTVEKAE